MVAITFGIITVSDSRFNKEREDTAGPKLEAEILKYFPESKVVVKTIVSDTKKIIVDTLKEYIDTKICNVIFTVGGTGFSPRDVTPEATKDVIDREAPGLAYTIILKSLAITETAMLSRATCGIKDETIIINLPGSAKAAVESFGFIKNTIPHAVALLLNDTTAVENAHRIVQSQATTSAESKVKMDNAASRNRRSTYPMMEVNDAVSIIFKECTPTVKTEIIPFEEILNRVLADDIVALEPVPPFRASIKDGYAVKASDGAGNRKVKTVIAAGDDPHLAELLEGEVIRISTGAPIPPGADAVVQVEDTTLIDVSEDKTQESIIRIDVTPKVGQDIREIGSDIPVNTVVFKKYDKITGFHIGVFAMLGITEVNVFRRPSVGVISTGNELRDAREKLYPGQIRDSNKLTLLHLLKRYGYDAMDCGIARDNPNSIKSTLEKALSHNDVVVTSGGISMGEYDLIKNIIVQDFDGMIHFGRVNMKPGKPTTFATLMYNGKLKIIFGLPGNPASCCVTCILFVIPTLKFLERHREFSFPQVSVELRDPKENCDERPEYVRVRISAKSGRLVATSTGDQVSSRLNSMAGANGLVRLPGRKEKGEIINDEYSAILFDELM